MSLSQQTLEQAFNFLTNNGIQTAFAFATGAISALAVRKWRLACSKRNLHNGLMGFDRILVQEVRFDPSGVANTETGNEFFDMKIRTINDHQAVHDIFSPAIEEAMLDYLTKAIKHCTMDEPIVFQHLDKVLPKDEEKRTAILQHLEGDWINRFSSMLLQRCGDTRSFGLHAREVQEEVDVPVLLTYNPEAERKQLRIFIFPRNQDIPARADVRFRLDEDFVKAPDQLALPEWQKYKLFTAIQDALENGEAWESWRYAVSVPTGRSKAVAPPKFAANDTSAEDQSAVESDSLDAVMA